MTAASNPVDAGIAFRAAMYDACKTLFTPEAQHLIVTRTFPSVATEDMVLIGSLDGLRNNEDPRSSSQRTQDWDLSLDIHTYAFRAGGGDAEQEADDQAYEAAGTYMSRIAEYVRRSTPNGDTTLGGKVMWSGLESFTTEPGRVSAAQGTGRMWEFIGTFVARSRVTG